MLDNQTLDKLNKMALSLKDYARGGAGGLRRSRQMGSSVEFSDFREYATGDDIRRVDWNAYARFDKLFLKLFMQEQEAVVHMVVDASASMAAKWDTALEFLQALSYLALSAGDRVRVWALSDKAQPGPTYTGRKDFMKLCAHLEGLAPQGPTCLDTALTRLPLNKGMSFVVSDLFSPEGYQKGLSYLRYQKQQVAVLHLLSCQEVSPDLEGALRLIDRETGDKIDLMAGGAAMRRYKAALDAFRDEAHAFCHGRGMDYLPCQAGPGALDQLLRALTQRGAIK